MLCPAEEQAETIDKLGPLKPYLIATVPEAMLIIEPGTKKGEILRGEGESEAVDVYANAFQKDPDFYSFYRSMQAYGNVLGEEGTTMILSPDSEFLEFFNNSKGSN